jgi:hypothetical protein
LRAPNTVQSLAVAKSPHAKDDQEFVDATSAWDGE